MLTGVALSLVACFSLVKDVWLTQAIKITPHVTVSEPLNITVASIQGGIGQDQLGRGGYLGAFVSELIMGLKDSTVLHQDTDGEISGLLGWWILTQTRLSSKIFQLLVCDQIAPNWSVHKST